MRLVGRSRQAVIGLIAIVSGAGAGVRIAARGCSNRDVVMMLMIVMMVMVLISVPWCGAYVNV